MRPFRREDSDVVDGADPADAFGDDLVTRADAAVEYPHERDDAEEVVEPGVDDQRLERRLRGTVRGRDACHEGLQERCHARAGLGADAQDPGGIDADDVLDLRRYARGIRLREIDLVEHRQDFEALVDRGIAIGDRLRLDALGGVHHEQGTLARGQRPGDLVAEIDVARGIDEVELVGLAVFGGVLERDALRLYGDAALALEVHGVEHLVCHFALAQGVAQLDEPIRQGRLAVVDMGDDREVADVARSSHCGHSTRLTSSVPRRAGRRC